MTLDGKDARFLDFMFLGGSANEAILVEIKTPMTKLLGRRYRKNVYPPSVALAGSVVQVNDYCHSLRENILLTKKAGAELNTFNPRRVVIVGTGSLSGIDIVTFDEFFRKLEHLAKVFSLVRKADSLPEEPKASGTNGQPTHRDK